MACNPLNQPLTKWGDPPLRVYHFCSKLSRTLQNHSDWMDFGEFQFYQSRIRLGLVYLCIYIVIHRLYNYCNAAGYIIFDVKIEHILKDILYLYIYIYKQRDTILYLIKSKQNHETDPKSFKPVPVSIRIKPTKCRDGNRCSPRVQRNLANLG